MFPEKDLFTLLTWSRGNVNLTWQQVLAAHQSVLAWAASQVPDGPCPVADTAAMEKHAHKFEAIYRQQEDIPAPVFLLESLAEVSHCLCTAASECVPEEQAPPAWKPKALLPLIMGAEMKDGDRDSLLLALGLPAATRPVEPSPVEVTIKPVE